jgi:hypothetical protein
VHTRSASAAQGEDLYVLPVQAPPQPVHTDSPVVAAKFVPAVQDVHTDAPSAAEIVPLAQSVHTVAELAPSTSEYLPLAQLVHAAEAAVRL